MLYRIAILTHGQTQLISDCSLLCHGGIRMSGICFNQLSLSKQKGNKAFSKSNEGTMSQPPMPGIDLFKCRLMSPMVVADLWCVYLWCSHYTASKELNLHRQWITWEGLGWKQSLPDGCLDPLKSNPNRSPLKTSRPHSLLSVTSAGVCVQALFLSGRF